MLFNLFEATYVKRRDVWQVLNMLVSILTAFAIALPVAHKMTFVSYAPSLMMSITIGPPFKIPPLCSYHHHCQPCPLTTRCSH